MTDTAGKNFIDLTANIVSAYLSNNPTPASEIPSLISQIHAALLRVSNGRAETALEPAKPAVRTMRGQVGPAGRLSDGGAELRGGAFAARQENGARPAAAAAEIARKRRARVFRKAGGAP